MPLNQKKSIIKSKINVIQSKIICIPAKKKGVNQAKNVSTGQKKEMQINWKKILTEREKKCHQVKKNVSSDRNNCVIWSKNMYQPVENMCQPVENMCQPVENLQQQIEKKCLQIEKILSTSRKKSCNRTKTRKC